MDKLKNNAYYLFDELGKMFPDAKCELEFKNPFELLVSVALSAQTTDKRVNIVTKELFYKYPDAFSLMNARDEDVLNIIKSIGLAKTKTKNIINLSKVLVEKFNGVVPKTIEELTILPGVGRKTASVVLSVGFNIPAIAVDTHVSRVSNRLGLTNSLDVLQIEKDLKEIYNINDWALAHHRLLFFGRYFCKAIKPNCAECKFKNMCVSYK